MTVNRPRAERGAFPPGTEHYGRSLLGAPLIWFPAPAASRESGLILAGTHGDENSSVVTLSCALRTLCNQVNHLIPTRVLVKGGEITCKMLK